MRLSVDDGCIDDMRIAELARRYDIETVFYWPVEWTMLGLDHGFEPLTLKMAKEIASDFEIGSHTITHRHLTKLEPDDAKWEIYRSKDLLEEMFNIRVRKFCPPRGYTNKELTDFTLRHYDSQRLTKGKGLVHIHPDSGANGNKPWRECINEDTEEIWCHSWELNKYDLWDELEQFLKEQYERR